jgi:hypothetical protein
VLSLDGFNIHAGFVIAASDRRGRTDSGDLFTRFKRAWLRAPPVRRHPYCKTGGFLTEEQAQPDGGFEIVTFTGRVVRGP